VHEVEFADCRSRSDDVGTGRPYEGCSGFQGTVGAGVPAGFGGVRPPAVARRARSDAVLDFAHRVRLFDSYRHLVRHRVTVLAYHRIAGVDDEDFSTFVPNVSATPDAFAEQMDYLRKNYNPISIDDLLAWLKGEGVLPPYAALVTFDDGYRDNLENALPILEKRQIPAVLFVATDCIGSDRPFYWDLAAYMFAHSSSGAADIPLLGRQVLGGRENRRSLAAQWIAKAKALPPSERQVAIDALRAVLAPPDNHKAFRNLHLTWQEVREMARKGMAIGAHTCGHPILAQVPTDVARDEILRSKRLIEDTLGTLVRTFAYPNGRASDFSEVHNRMLVEAGIEAAFTLVPGPSARAELRTKPMEIRRSIVTLKDTMPRFAAKLLGLGRVWKNI
jgi:peptidoglycan/xylan/chitin deacetylase (PgdA/CDA1 family)